MARVDSTITLKHRDPSDPDHPKGTHLSVGTKMFWTILGTVHFLLGKGGGGKLRGVGYLGSTI